MPNDIKKLRRLMSAANHLKKENPVILRGRAITPSQALKYAWWFESFRTKLSTGKYRFSYFKKEGSIREAVGTLNFDLIPPEQRPKVLKPDIVDQVEKYTTFTYYDLTVHGWRSFCIDLFIGFVENVGENS